MFRKLFYSFGFLVFISSAWAMEGKTDDGDGWLGNLPVMVRRDARQFQEAVHFSDLPDNPYAAYFQGALIGKVFHGGAADSDATINSAVSRLVTPSEARGARAYFKRSVEFEDTRVARHQSFLNHRQKLNGWHTAFKDHFDGNSQAFLNVPTLLPYSSRGLYCMIMAL